MAKMNGSECLLTLETHCHISGCKIQSQGGASGWISTFLPSSPVCLFGTAAQRVCKRNFSLRCTTEMSDYAATPLPEDILLPPACRNTSSPVTRCCWQCW